MSWSDRLEELRQSNKDLLNQLKQQTRILDRLCRSDHKREREDEAVGRPDSAEVQTLTRADSCSARAALAKPTVRFADECGIHSRIQHNISTPYLTSNHSRKTTATSFHLEDEDRPTVIRNKMQESRPTKSCLTGRDKEQREEQSSVTSQSDKCEERSASDRHHVQSLLGYDWIAGVLDAEDSLEERPDDFFNDLRTFRLLNRDECFHSPKTEFSEGNHPVLLPLTDIEGPEALMESHQCTFSYRINSRLFPVPLHHQECCPVCKRQKSSHPHKTAEPALIRVSIPLSSLLPPYKYKPHRRCSFNPSDSLGLPSHCLSAWSNKGQSALGPPSTLDLRSSLNTKRSMEEQLEDLPATKDLSVQVSDVSRLARHKFQHLAPKIKVGSTYHPPN